MDVHKLISVIVPVYNVEEYLEECLDSIKYQTHKNIEVILVNDGSTDGSKEICELYCKNDSRFKLINQVNQGLSEARNVGLQESVGEYIFFVDSDDVIKVDILETLLTFMIDNVDIVGCNFSSNKEYLTLQTNPKIVFQGNSSEALSNCLNYGAVRFFAWSKLYRRNIAEAVPFLKGLIYEDTYTGFTNLKYIRNMVVIDTIGYFYRVRQDSIMRKKYSEKNLDVFKICDSLLEEFQNHELFPYIGRFTFLVIIEHLLFYNIRKNHIYYKSYCDHIKKYANIAKKSSEVLRSCRILRWYLKCPKFFSRYLFILYFKYISIVNKKKANI